MSLKREWTPEKLWPWYYFGSVAWNLQGGHFWVLFWFFPWPGPQKIIIFRAPKTPKNLRASHMLSRLTFHMNSSQIILIGYFIDLSGFRFWNWRGLQKRSAHFFHLQRWKNAEYDSFNCHVWWFQTVSKENPGLFQQLFTLMEETRNPQNTSSNLSVQKCTKTFELFIRFLNFALIVQDDTVHIGLILFQMHLKEKTHQNPPFSHYFGHISKFSKAPKAIHTPKWWGIKEQVTQKIILLIVMKDFRTALVLK